MSTDTTTMEEQMLRAERLRLEVLFQQLDTNHDGRIDLEELTQGLRRMGYYNLSSDDIQQFFRQSDTNLSGELDKNEFVSYLQNHVKQLRVVFASMDQNQDGKISLDEVVTAFRKIGITVSLSEAASLLKRMNPSDKSVDICFEEWRHFLLFNPSGQLEDIIARWRRDTRQGAASTTTTTTTSTTTTTTNTRSEPPSTPRVYGRCTFTILEVISNDHLIELDLLGREVIDLGEDIGVPDDFTEQELISGMWWRHLVAGGVAGAVSRTCTAPLDRLKIMLQVHGGRKKLSIGNAFSYMLKEGGVWGLWRGNGINVIKIAPESAIKFAAYDFFKRVIKGDEDREIYTSERFLAGSLAGGVSQTTIYPLEVLKTRLALRKTGEYNGIMDCARKLYATDGIRVFYRGYIPNILGILPYAGIDLTVYETLKKYYLANYCHDGGTPPAYTLLSCGTFSSCCGQVAAYPLALVRTKLQSQAGLNLSLPVEQTRMMGLFRYIIRTEGIRGLYRGIVPNFCKVAPAVSISYYVYERTREHLGVEMV